MPRIDRIAFGALFLVWLGSFALCLDDLLRDMAAVPVLAAPAPTPEAHPRVVAMRPGQPAADLQPGDVLLSVDGSSLQGAGAVALATAFASLSPGTPSAHLVLERGGERLERDVPLRSQRRLWPRLLASLAFVACAAFLVAAPRPTRLRRTLAFTYLATAVFFVCFFAGRSLETAAGMFVQAASLSVLAPLSVRGFLLMPHGRAPEGRLARFGPWLFAAFGPLDLSRFEGVPWSHATGALGLAVLVVPFFVVSALILIRGYRSADAIGRRKLRWVLLGIYLASAIAGIPELFAARLPEAGSFFAVSVSGIAVLPLCVAIGVVRHNFLDVDRLLSVTTVATLAVIGVLLSAQLLLPATADSLAAATGAQAATVKVLLVVLIAALFLPSVGSLGRGVDRLLFRYRFELERRIAELIQDLSLCATPEALAETAGERIHALFAPTACTIYTRSGDVLAPAVSVGEPGATPSFAVTSPLVAAIQEQRGPLSRDADGEAFASLGSFQRAVLETLGAALVIPVRREGQLAAFLCLGDKLTGDVYTASDRTLLALTADKVGSELLRFDQQEMIRASRTLQERFRSYVPGPVAEEIRQGREVDVGEAEVSVLFVDIRGYSRFAEPLRPEEIFQLVSRYTQVVSSAVRDHGGTVVEFSGDGMMAVFGAPLPLGDKAASAVAAGRMIVERVRALAGDRGDLSVGVGIATGTAFVGNIQTVDRMIWTALGNTTNLASRLQSMTRDLPAAMIIDRPTYESAGEASAAFVPYVGMPIRGRRERQDVYLLPLDRAA